MQESGAGQEQAMAIMFLHTYGKQGLIGDALRLARRRATTRLCGPISAVNCACKTPYFATRIVSPTKRAFQENIGKCLQAPIGQNLDIAILVTVFPSAWFFSHLGFALSPPANVTGSTLGLTEHEL